MQKKHITKQFKKVSAMLLRVVPDFVNLLPAQAWPRQTVWLGLARAHVKETHHQAMKNN